MGSIWADFIWTVTASLHLSESTANRQKRGGSVGTDDASERLKQLIQTGKARGYILYDEIDELLTQIGNAHLDIALTEFAVNGIDIL
jgi:hypothetical protein